MKSQSANTFLTSMAFGIIIGILIAPIKGIEMRKILFSQEDDIDWGDHGVYNINELTGKDSDTFDKIRSKFKA